MQDDLTRAEHYTAMATSMLRTAELETDQRRRAKILIVANEYAFLADRLLQRRNSLDYS
jgi:hypothetical protein